MGGEGVLVAAPDELWTDDGRIHRIDGHYPQGWTGLDKGSCSVPDPEGELGDLFVDLPAFLHLG
jgi:hypothetical protein